jgi:hypothetical protein
MCGAIHPLPHTPSWHGVQLKSTGTTLPLYITLVFKEKECSNSRSLPVLLKQIDRFYL